MFKDDPNADQDPGPGQADQIAAWPSRLDAPIGNATHYVDFHVDVPDVGGGTPSGQRGSPQPP